MTDNVGDIQAGIVDAVQQELARFGKQVSASVQSLRDELAAEHSARLRTEEVLRSLMPQIESHISEFSAQTKRRHDEMERRIGRVVDDTNASIAAAAEAATRPLVKQFEHRQGELEARVASVDGSIRKFDQQVGAMVQQFNEVHEATESRIDQVSLRVSDDLSDRLSALSTRVDDVSTQAARQQADIANVVTSRVDQAEERVNERVAAVESRLSESLGQRIADIDAYVGRVSVGLDGSVDVLSDRIAAAESRFGDVVAAIDALAERVDAVDVDAIDEIKDRVTGALGEVELVRIEIERFQVSMTQSLDKAVARLVDLETQLQEQRPYAICTGRPLVPFCLEGIKSIRTKPARLPLSNTAALTRSPTARAKCARHRLSSPRTRA